MSKAEYFPPPNKKPLALSHVSGCIFLAFCFVQRQAQHAAIHFAQLQESAPHVRNHPSDFKTVQEDGLSHRNAGPFALSSLTVNIQRIKSVVICLYRDS